jgi:hypothetical protein
MQSWPGPARKENQEKELRERVQPQFRPPRKANQEKLSVRVALLVLLAQYVALADAGLMYLARQAVPLVVVSAMAAFAAAYKFFDGLIEEGLELAGVRCR